MVYSTRTVGTLLLVIITVAIVVGFYGPTLATLEILIFSVVLIFGSIFGPVKSVALWLLALGLGGLGLVYGNYSGQEFNLRLGRLSEVVTSYEWTGRVVSPAIEQEFGQLEFVIKTESGLVSIQSRSGLKPQLGEIIIVEGDTRPPGRDQAGYARYLVRQGVSAVVRAKSVEPVRQESLGLGDYLILTRETLRKSLISAVPGRAGELVAGMAFGGETVRDESLLKAMNITGTRHLVAISGFNIGIIGAGAMGLLLLMGLKRRWATLGALGLIGIYVLVTGLSASSVRAAIMGGLLLLALSRGFGTQILRLLALAGGVMILLAPGIAEDVGFQLSFAAVGGIVLLTPVIQSALKRIAPNWLAEALAVVVAAQGAVAPLLWYHFGSVSATSLVYNFLLLPLVPLSTILAIFTSGLGLISSTLAQILALPLAAIVNLMTDLIFWGSRFPALINISTGNGLLVVVIYAALIYLGLGQRSRELAMRRERHRYAQ